MRWTQCASCAHDSHTLFLVVAIFFLLLIRAAAGILLVAVRLILALLVTREFNARKDTSALA